MKALLIILCFLAASCSTDIPFSGFESHIVVESWITDIDTIQEVRVTRTVAFTTNQKNDLVSDATVEVKEYENDNLINSVSFMHSENGYYQSNVSFGNTEGNRYQLEVTLSNGEVINSTLETAIGVRPITSLTYDFFVREPEEGPEPEETVYYPIARTSDPPDTTNYYRWKLYRNNTLFQEPNEIFLFSDRFINSSESYTQEFTAYEYELGDTIKTERLSISRKAFDFLSELKLQTTSLGTNTAVSPAVVRGNLSYQSSNDIVLGFFGVVSVTDAEIIISD